MGNQSIKGKVVVLENTFYTVQSLRLEILAYLTNRGYEVHVLSTGPKEDRLKLEHLGYSCIDVGSVVMNPVKALFFFYNLIRLMSKIEPQIIFSFTVRPNIFGSLAARMLKIPIVSNVTGTGPLIEDKSILYKLIRLSYKIAFKKNQRVFFQNEDDYNYFLSKGFVRKDQVKLLPGSGVDTEFYKPLQKEGSDFVFLLISRLVKDKGVLDFVEAARIIKAKTPSIRFQILGPFWTQSISKNTISKVEMDAWVAEGIVEYMGYTDDVRPFIAESNTVVLPSYREGCANVLMQSASMEKPLIGTDVTGCRNLIDDKKTGLLCEVRNPKDLANKMMDMINLSEEERLEMGKKGRLKMKNEYPKFKVLEAYEEELGV